MQKPTYTCLLHVGLPCPYLNLHYMIGLFNKPLHTWGSWASIDNTNAMHFEQLKEYTLEFASVITLKDLRMSEVANPLSDGVGNLL